MKKTVRYILALFVMLISVQSAFSQFPQRNSTQNILIS